MIQRMTSMNGSSGELNVCIERMLVVGAPAAARPAASAVEPLVEPLSVRELDVLRLMALGDSNAEIARKLVITLNTTKKHVTHIFEKLEVSNRCKAIVRARDLGMVG
jgi:LuxR family transcriptional regulator, maltose regulon positive regulatory protein